MLELHNITKDYIVAGGAVHALKGVTIMFRKNEFVSILGASGCGKTTLLNIIGGLDKYTSGDLVIAGKSTARYKDGDWDTYRNHSIGFIFQSYHLIPHQSILQNVELALTISGVSKEERRKRAVAALEKVGLSDKLHVRPNQLSGGQAQRVAIARALINNPEIVLADEPTGALDSKTSIQIMELLKEIARDRLVIMVTHNPELAESYSTRIIRLLDGKVTADSMPYSGEEEGKETLTETPPETAETLSETADETTETPTETLSKTPQTDAATDGNLQISEQGEKAQESAKPDDISGGSAKNKEKKGKKKSSMSVGMAFSLSLKNLLSKWKRTLMVAIAGSIGIIGVSMVLAISSGVKGYIASMQNDMLSGYPLEITRTAIDFDSLMNMGTGTKIKTEKLGDKVYVDSLIETLMGMGSAGVSNTVTDGYFDYVSKMPSSYYNAVYYDYGFEPANNIYTTYKLDKDDAGEEISVTGIRQTYSAVLGAVASEDNKTEAEKQQYKMFAQMIPTVTTFEELPNNYEYVLSQYDIVATYNDKTVNLTEDELKDLFCQKDSLIMVINKKATTDLTMGQMGYFTQEEFLSYADRAKDVVDGELTEEQLKEKYDEILKEYLNGKEYDYFLDKGEETKFKWYPNDTVYTQAALSDGLFVPHEAEGDQRPNYVPAKYKYNAYTAGFAADRDKTNDVDLKVKVILQKKAGVSYGCLSTGIYYTNALSQHALETGRRSNIVNYMNENGGSLDGLPYKYHFTYKTETPKNSVYYIMDTESASMMSSMFGGSADVGKYDALKLTPSALGGGTIPVGFAFYPLDFDTKDLVTDYLDKWNDMCAKGETYKWTVDDGNGTSTEYSMELKEENKITYTDAVGLIITMVNVMVEMITIALVAFTALSLVVSTVMVGIITYVSVVERIKEIGILRAVGARKKDIKRLFNAETFIIGLAAGVVGIAVTYLLSGILNLIIGGLAGIYSIAALPIWQALIMICVSVVLTLISGLIPASAAAKKDPVVALRTE